MFLKIFLNIYSFITLKLKRMLKTFYLLKCKITYSNPIYKYMNLNLVHSIHKDV